MQSQSGIERLAQLPPSERDEILSGFSESQIRALLYDWRNFIARPAQVAPKGDWDIWLILAGRGFGKTRAGAEWVREQVDAGVKRIALIGETQRDLEKVMVEGESGILNVFPENERPHYTKKPVQLVFPNGAIAQGYNATEPEQLRGPQFEAAWCDEIAKWRYARETWDQLQFALRLGKHPRQVVTTTPKPIELLKSILTGAEGEVEITRGSTYDNKSNLSARFLSRIENRYAGTRLGRQELNAEMLGDLPGALWTRGNLDIYRLAKKDAPKSFKKVIVCVDPAVTNTEKSDAHGIIVIGLDEDNEVYVLEDFSRKGSPTEWGRAVQTAYNKHQADYVVAEVNQGGDMVEMVIKSVDPMITVKQVRATRGKHVRAEPVASLYEQGRVHHIGAFADLEDEMCYMTQSGYEGPNSPDRLDALVWGVTELLPIVTKRKSKPSPPRPSGGPGSWMG